MPDHSAGIGVGITIGVICIIVLMIAILLLVRRHNKAKLSQDSSKDSIHESEKKKLCAQVDGEYHISFSGVQKDFTHRGTGRDMGFANPEEQSFNQIMGEMATYIWDPTKSHYSLITSSCATNRGRNISSVFEELWGKIALLKTVLDDLPDSASIKTKLLISNAVTAMFAQISDVWKCMEYAVDHMKADDTSLMAMDTSSDRDLSVTLPYVTPMIWRCDSSTCKQHFTNLLAMCYSMRTVLSTTKMSESLWEKHTPDIWKRLDEVSKDGYTIKFRNNGTQNISYEEVQQRSSIEMDSPKGRATLMHLGETTPKVKNTQPDPAARDDNGSLIKSEDMNKLLGSLMYNEKDGTPPKSNPTPQDKPKKPEIKDPPQNKPETPVNRPNDDEIVLFFKYDAHRYRIEDDHELPVHLSTKQEVYEPLGAYNNLLSAKFTPYKDRNSTSQNVIFPVKNNLASYDQSAHHSCQLQYYACGVFMHAQTEGSKQHVIHMLLPHNAVKTTTYEEVDTENNTCTVAGLQAKQIVITPHFSSKKLFSSMTAEKKTEEVQEIWESSLSSLMSDTISQLHQCLLARKAQTASPRIHIVDKLSPLIPIIQECINDTLTIVHFYLMLHEVAEIPEGITDFQDANNPLLPILNMHPYNAIFPSAFNVSSFDMQSLRNMQNTIKNNEKLFTSMQEIAHDVHDIISANPHNIMSGLSSPLGYEQYKDCLPMLMHFEKCSSLQDFKGYVNPINNNVQNASLHHYSHQEHSSNYVLKDASEGKNVTLSMSASKSNSRDISSRKSYVLVSPSKHPDNPSSSFAHVLVMPTSMNNMVSVTKEGEREESEFIALLISEPEFTDVTSIHRMNHDNARNDSEITEDTVQHKNALIIMSNVENEKKDPSDPDYCFMYTPTIDASSAKIAHPIAPKISWAITTICDHYEALEGRIKTQHDEQYTKEITSSLEMIAHAAMHYGRTLIKCMKESTCTETLKKDITMELNSIITSVERISDDYHLYSALPPNWESEKASYTKLLQSAPDLLPSNTGGAPDEKEPPKPDLDAGGKKPDEKEPPKPDLNAGSEEPDKKEPPKPDLNAGSEEPDKKEPPKPDLNAGSEEPDKKEPPKPDLNAGGKKPDEKEPPKPDLNAGSEEPDKKEPPKPDLNAGSEEPDKKEPPKPDLNAGGKKPDEKESPKPPLPKTSINQRDLTNDAMGKNTQPNLSVDEHFRDS